ncbi:MAG: dienelactone hydrolase family protein [Planctomycetes bacterium]|nr:dienelactone hydrolase family protein [Planctomycetota bacterium]
MTTAALLACAGCPLVSPFGSPSARTVDLSEPGDHDQALVWQNLTRTYIVHTPAGYNAAIPTPLVIVLHGGWGTGEQAARELGFSELSDQRGFIVAYPDGYLRNWNDGRGGLVAEITDLDDVGFILAMIDAIARSLNLDRRRVYAVGVSNGAIFANRLACERPDRFAAFAAVIGTYPEALDCRPTVPVSALIIVGDQDPLVPYDGGEVSSGGTVLSAAETTALWIAADSCSTTPQITQLPHLNPDDPTRVRRESYSGCAEGTAVVLYVVEGGGHTWPGGPAGLSTVFRGPVTQDLDATQSCWDFFAAHAEGG